MKFFALTRNAQDRFIAATSGAVPRPILALELRPAVPWGWIAATLICAVAFVVLVGWGLGDLENELALSPAWMVAAFGTTLGGAVCFGMQAAARFLEARKLPYRRGRYLFGSGLVDATRPVFRVRSLLELEVVEAAGAGVALRFGGGQRVVLPLPRSASHADVEQRIQQARAELQTAQVTQNAQAEAALDPLSEPRYSNPLAPRQPRRVPRPAWRKFSLPLALVLGAGLGFTTGVVRNRKSERELYAAARRADTPEAYRAYLARGGVRPDVAALLLPSAELARVVRGGSLDELRAFVESHAGSAVEPAAHLHLREALLAELGTARERGTMTALREFAERHPKFLGLVQAELVAARRELSQKAGQSFTERHAAKTAGLADFVEALMRELADSGPRVIVRFQRVVPESVARADTIVQRDKYFAKVMLPSQYFDAERSRQREAVLFERLAQKFDAAFPKDVLELVHGEPIEKDDTAPSQVEVPTLVVSHSTNMGTGIPNQKPNGTFVGIGFLFRGRFLLPGKTPPLEMKHSIWRLPDLLRLRRGKMTIPQVYLTMADDAFSAFDDKLVGWLFRDSSK